MGPWDVDSQQMGLQPQAPIQGAMPFQPPVPQAYPAMPNSYNLGDQATPGNPSNPSFQAQPLNSVMPDSGSRGFNPWSLQGEAISRGR